MKNEEEVVTTVDDIPLTTYVKLQRRAELITGLVDPGEVSKVVKEIYFELYLHGYMSCMNDIKAGLLKAGFQYEHVGSLTEEGVGN